MNRTYSLACLIALALVRGLLYLSIIPPWQAPDETSHYHAVRLLLEQHGPKDINSQIQQAMQKSITNWHFSSLFTSEQSSVLDLTTMDWPRAPQGRLSVAYLPYELALWFSRNSSIETQLYAMRLVSVVIGAAVVALAFQTGRLVAPDRPALAWGAALFVLFLPQHTFMLAAVSDGNLPELFASLTFYLLIKLLKPPFDWRTGFLCLFCAGTAILSKSTAFFLVPLVAVSGGVIVSRYWRTRPWITWTAAAVGVIGVGLVWYLFTRFAPGSLAASLDLASVQRLIDPAVYASLNSQDVFASALRGTFTSFWANLGWMRLPLPYAWYYALMALTGLALLGFGWGLTRLRTEARMVHAFCGLAAALPVAVLVARFVSSPVGTDMRQGRYLFGGIVPIAIVLVVGWLNWAPSRYGRLVVWGMVSGLVALDTAVLYNLAIPFFYR
jgi:4-amino-4-deoxy-L-arabinose transferase-like glycosyltransferase